MDYQEIYNQNLMSAEEAVNLIPKAGSLVMGMEVSQPPALLKALEHNVKDNLKKNKAESQATYEDAEALRIYYMHPGKQAAGTILQYKYRNAIRPHPFSMGPIEEDLFEQGKEDGVKCVFFMSSAFNRLPHLFEKSIATDACIVMVSPMDKAGFFSCGTNSDYIITAANYTKKLIIEVNPNMPRTFGDSCVHISNVAAIIEHESELAEIELHPIDETTRLVAQNVIDMIPNRATLQIGIGAAPNAVCEALIKHQDLGIHTDVMTPSLIKLIQSGAVTNRYKKTNRHKNVYTLALGNKESYAFIHDNPSMVAYSTDYVNNPNIIGQNDNFTSINSFMEVDFDGRINAEYIKGREHGTPGSTLDFIQGARLSRGGKSILAAPSTAGEEMSISRIVPKIEGPAIDPQADN